MRTLLPLMLLTACSATPFAADDDDATTPTPEEDWDPTEPTVPDGTRLFGTMSCSIFDGLMEKAWQKQEDYWIEIPGFDAVLLPGLEGCLAVSDRHLFWDADGSIRFIAGGWEHRLEPTETEDLWIGEAEPIGEPDPTCLDALAVESLTLPVALSFERTEILVP